MNTVNRARAVGEWEAGLEGKEEGGGEGGGRREIGRGEEGEEGMERGEEGEGKAEGRGVRLSPVRAGSSRAGQQRESAASTAAPSHGRAARRRLRWRHPDL